jgi:DNA-binding transcriptional MerR regulator
MTADNGPVIPDKAFFRIGEVADIVGVKPYVIRYWETEFKQLRPNKSRTNQRVYSRGDVQLLITIKTLLYTDGFTIEGARKQLTKSARVRTGALPFPDGDGDDDTGAEAAPALESQQVKSFLTELDDSKSELSRLRRRVDDAEARVSELETKLVDERKARTMLTAWVRKEINETMQLVDSTVEAETAVKISSS